MYRLADRNYQTLVADTVAFCGSVVVVGEDGTTTLPGVVHHSDPVSDIAVVRVEPRAARTCARERGTAQRDAARAAIAADNVEASGATRRAQEAAVKMARKRKKEGSKTNRVHAEPYIDG